MKHVLLKIKKNKENTWREWCLYLTSHELESKETMRQENAVYERSLLYMCDDEYYVLGTNIFEGQQRKANMSIELNQLHHQKRNACLGPVIIVIHGDVVLPKEYEVLYEFDLRI